MSRGYKTTKYRNWKRSLSTSIDTDRLTQAGSQLTIWRLLERSDDREYVSFDGRTYAGYNCPSLSFYTAALVDATINLAVAYEDVMRESVEQSRHDQDFRDLVRISRKMLTYETGSFSAPLVRALLNEVFPQYKIKEGNK